MSKSMDEKYKNEIPSHPPVAKGFLAEGPSRFILMTPLMSTVGALLVFFAVAFTMVVILPIMTVSPPPSTNWAPISQTALDGRGWYLANGCLYCHSAYTRPQDIATGLYYLYPRVSEPGDFWAGAESPNLFGTERTGPDLSQEAGSHPDDWHGAHYFSPRATNPLSVMPRFDWMSDSDIALMIAFNQSQGGKEGTLRYATQVVGKQMMLITQGGSPEDIIPDLLPLFQERGLYQANGNPTDASPWGLTWFQVWMLNSFERGYWLTNDPLPVTQQNLLIGKQTFLNRCVGCHGLLGDGYGAASDYLLPNAFNFTNSSTTDGVQGPFASDGMFYHRILTAGKGTAMENFGTRLSVEEIWRVVLFLRTVQNGTLRSKNLVPTPQMWQAWQPPDALLSYVAAHPIQSGPGVIAEADLDPFMAAAHWLAPGLAPADQVLVGGKIKVDQTVLADMIRTTYLQMMEQNYADALSRGKPMPPKDQVLSTEGIVFHAP